MSCGYTMINLLNSGNGIKSLQPALLSLSLYNLDRSSLEILYIAVKLKKING